MKIGYLRGVCGVNRMDDESTVSVDARFCMSRKGEGINCKVTVKGRTLKRFSHLEWVSEWMRRI